MEQCTYSLVQVILYVIGLVLGVCIVGGFIVALLFPFYSKLSEKWERWLDEHL